MIIRELLEKLIKLLDEQKLVIMWDHTSIFMPKN